MGPKIQFSFGLFGHQQGLNPIDKMGIVNPRGKPRCARTKITNSYVD
jgi:hypothetical protein